uniref:Lipoprotein n=1 Tax=Myxococcus fulvus TaxID=33 RepID=A0A7D5NGV6_MYXFU|nr:lipoprotein [Myxococcus fulvus]
MRVGVWCVLAGLGGWGCGGVVEDVSAPEKAQVRQSQACAPGAVYKVKDILPPEAPLPSPWSPVPDWLTNAQGTLFFTADLYPDRSILWRSDGTSEGTVPVREFVGAGPGSQGLASLTAVGTRVFFLVSDSLFGRELWVSDGTNAGTRLVRDLAVGTGSSYLSNLQAVGNVLTFFRRPSVDGPVELWRSDGTEAGTFRLRDFGTQYYLVPHVRPVPGQRLFILQDAANGTALWRTDGTAGGTVLVKRLDAGQISMMGSTHADTGWSVFILHDQGPITEVWRTDGTPGGTVRLESFGGSLGLLGVLGGHVYLSAATPDGAGLRISRVSLTGGDKATVTTVPNRFAGEPGAWPFVQMSTVAGGRLYWSMGIGTPGPAPREVGLWSTDGTASGTWELARGLNTSDERSSPLLNTGAGTLLFSNSDGMTGLEPWVTDGTPGRTGLVADLTPLGGSRPEAFTRVGSTVFFRAYSNTRGDALWAMPANVTCRTQAVDAR